MIYDYFAAVDTDGIVRKQLRRAVPNDGAGMPNDSLVYHPVAAPIDWSAQPTPTSVLLWSGGAMVWSDPATLDQAKARAWEDAKQARDEAENAPFEFEGAFYDPDKVRISGAALAALLAQLAGQEMADEWTLADNTRRTLSGAQIINLGLALTQRVKAIHERGRILRDLIDSAATPAEAYAHTWESLNAE